MVFRPPNISGGDAGRPGKEIQSFSRPFSALLSQYSLPNPSWTKQALLIAFSLSLPPFLPRQESKASTISLMMLGAMDSVGKLPALTVPAHRASRTFLNCSHKGRENFRSAPPTPPCCLPEGAETQAPRDPTPGFPSPSKPFPVRRRTERRVGREALDSEGCDWLPPG